MGTPGVGGYSATRIISHSGFLTPPCCPQPPPPPPRNRHPCPLLRAPKEAPKGLGMEFDLFFFTQGLKVNFDKVSVFSEMFDGIAKKFEARKLSYSSIALYCGSVLGKNKVNPIAQHTVRLKKSLQKNLKGNTTDNFPSRMRTKCSPYSSSAVSSLPFLAVFQVFPSSVYSNVPISLPLILSSSSFSSAKLESRLEKKQSIQGIYPAPFFEP